MTAFTLGKRASFWVAAAVVAHTLWTSAAPAMTYPLYAAQWGLTATTTTSIFAIYPIVVVAVLMVFGDLSDSIGRRAAMVMGLSASLAGVLMFAVAPDVAWIFAGRIMMGIGVGLSAGPATAAMIEFGAGRDPHHTSALTTAAQALGLASAILIGGALIQYAPCPTRLNFWVLFLILAVLLAATWMLPRRVAGEKSQHWRPKTVAVPQGIRLVFATSAASVMTGYSLGALMLSLGAQIAHDLIGSANALVSAAAISLFAVVWGIVSVFSKRLAPAAAMAAGGVASMTAMGLLVLSAQYHSLPAFLASTAAAGIGYSQMFMGGLHRLSVNTPAHQRGGTLSALYLVAYLTMGIVALLLGMATTRWGLMTGLDLGAALIGLLSVGALALVGAGARSTRSLKEVEIAPIPEQQSAGP